MDDKIGALIETAIDLIRDERQKATRFGTMGWIITLEMTKEKLEEALKEWNE